MSIKVGDQDRLIQGWKVSKFAEAPGRLRSGMLLVSLSNILLEPMPMPGSRTQTHRRSSSRCAAFDLGRPLAQEARDLPQCRWQFTHPTKFHDRNSLVPFIQVHIQRKGQPAEGLCSCDYNPVSGSCPRPGGSTAYLVAGWLVEPYALPAPVISVLGTVGLLAVVAMVAVGIGDIGC